jgi:hypothetical protein
MCDCQLQPAPIITVKDGRVFPLSFNCQALLFTTFSTSENSERWVAVTRKGEDLLKKAGLILCPSEVIGPVVSVVEESDKPEVQR